MRVSFIQIVFLLPLLLFTSSCDNSLSEKNYVSWIEDQTNGLHVVKEFDDFVFDVQYQPNDFLWLQSNKKENSSRASQVDESQQYLLKIVSENLNADWIKTGSSNEIQNKLYYFSYLFQNDIFIEEEGTILPCTMVHFEQGQRTSATKIFLLSFENKFPDSKTSTLVIGSRYFGSLPLRIKISKNDIPNLKL
jgi:hypothetical protein